MAAQNPPLVATHPPGFPELAVAGRAAALRLFIPGNPIPKGRPRARIQNIKGPKPFAQIYTDPVTREWETHVEQLVRHQLIVLGQLEDDQVLTLPFQDRVLVSLRFNIDKPQSYPRHVVMPIKAKGDIDNMAKSVIDGIQNAGVIANDRLITDLTCIRRYADPAHPVGVEVDLTGLG